MSLLRGAGRGRAFLRFLLSVAWLLATYFLAERAAHGFSYGATFPLLRSLFEIFLLIIGYSYMELAWDNTREPLRAMGLVRRAGMVREFGLGASIGWGMATAVLVSVALFGHLYVRIWTSLHAWRFLVLQIMVFAATSLAAEIAFRGYTFQKLVQATGPFTATVLAGIFFALLRHRTPGATVAAMWISGMAAVLLSIAYLRTRALWVGWGIHFAWLASVALLFGQPLAGHRQAASVVQTYADGPTWLTGSEFGPEASVVALLMLWFGLYAVVRITRGFALQSRQANVGVVSSPPIQSTPVFTPPGVPPDASNPPVTPRPVQMPSPEVQPPAAPPVSENSSTEEPRNAFHADKVNPDLPPIEESNKRIED